MVDVAIGLLYHEGRVLISRRLKEAHLGGLWEFPGGKCERGESSARCVIRELREELGVDVRPIHPFRSIEFTSATRNVRLHPWLCELTSGSPQALASLELRWVMPIDLSSYEFPPANSPLIEELLTYLGRRE